MDIDAKLRETADRWRLAQPPAPGIDFEMLLVTGAKRRRRPWWVIAAAGAAAVLVAVSLLLHAAVTSTRTPSVPATSASDAPTMASDQIVGTWYASVTLTQTRARHKQLVGDWIMTLDAQGGVRLSRAQGAFDLPGRWQLSGSTLEFSIPFTGCASAQSSYTATLSELHTGLLELVDVPGTEDCVARSLVLDGHWFLNPTSR